ncbi:MAG: hypothetical protein PHP22_05675 [Oscillospiraceae bacterium]|jgi:hypothetical protein|nr:hypothetical protein [Oscillospiraceae bacterium]
MTDREFTHQLRRGIGSAIVELHNSEARLRYKPIALRCCLQNIAYDWQSEGTKGGYLYSAIVALGAREEFLPSIANAYRKRISYGLMTQLTDILVDYVRDGSEDVMNVLREKYDLLRVSMSRQRVFPLRFCEREQFEYLMLIFIQQGNWRTFKDCVEDAGRIILARKDDLCSDYDWFFDCAEDQFGKARVRGFFEESKETSLNVRAVFDAINRAERSRENHQNELQKLSPITAKDLVDEVRRTPPNSGKYYPGIGLIFKFVREAEQKDIVFLARCIETETNLLVKAKLLLAFRRVDYPSDIAPLIEWADSDEEDLRDAAVMALGRLRDPRIHNLAVRFLENGDIDSGLTLMESNYRRSDDDRIRKAVMRSRRVSHETQMSLRDIYLKYRSAACKAALMHAYRNGQCGFCRFGIVEAMGRNGVLTDDILRECLWDSYDETRRYANRRIRRGGHG